MSTGEVEYLCCVYLDRNGNVVKVVSADGKEATKKKGEVTRSPPDVAITIGEPNDNQGQVTDPCCVTLANGDVHCWC